ncbi:hypothetical protein HPB50_027386 [Hyalomma asiaticum]|uniref:Uncharacterized protein n=1 Tax=Hyalomma asiaticum TaxID=266040 RepID=A0ACB7TPR8_HYAAI|nr:hypothetical protein HPB50_027386 [Hyalomma asiaticum]
MLGRRAGVVGRPPLAASRPRPRDQRRRRHVPAKIGAALSAASTKEALPLSSGAPSDGRRPEPNVRRPSDTH